MPDIMSPIEAPEDIARRAGVDMYGTSVGGLRRMELARLANAWGMRFPDGATKDEMLPFFKQLEADKKNPFKPPYPIPDRPTSSGESRCENLQEEIPPAYSAWKAEREQEKLLNDMVKPAPASDFERKLSKLPMNDLRKLCKARNIKMFRNNSHATLVQRVLSAVNGEEFVQDVPTGG